MVTSVGLITSSAAISYVIGSEPTGVQPVGWPPL